MGDISPSFSRLEFACKCSCGFDAVDSVLLDELQRLRNFTGNRITILSGNRCADHNRYIGGSLRSQHILAKAVDFVVEDMAPHAVQDLLEEWHPTQYGIGRYPNRTHFDVRDDIARWKMFS